MFWDQVGKENQEKEEFIKSYLADSVEDEILAMSGALKAFYESQGYHFGTEEETFILPSNL